MESKQIEDRCQEIETAMNEIVDTVERYFLIAPFQWIEGTNGELHITWFDLVARKKRPKPLIPEAPALSPRFSAIFRPLYIVSFCIHDDRRPSKFIVLTDNMKAAIRRSRFLHLAFVTVTNCPYCFVSYLRKFVLGTVVA